MAKKAIKRDEGREKASGGKYKGIFLYGKEEMIGEQIPSDKVPGKVHVSLYLKGKGTKIWEQGGKIAFAQAKGLTHGTEKEFDALFSTY